MLLKFDETKSGDRLLIEMCNAYWLGQSSLWRKIYGLRSGDGNYLYYRLKERDWLRIQKATAKYLEERASENVDK